MKATPTTAQPELALFPFVLIGDPEQPRQARRAVEVLTRRAPGWKLSDCRQPAAETPDQHLARIQSERRAKEEIAAARDRMAEEEQSAARLS